MQLSFQPFDGRSYNIRDVIDKDTDRVVGYIRSKSSPLRGIEISLFDGKYATNVSTYEECMGFVKGVNMVLSHMAYSPYIPPADTIPIRSPEPIERRI